MTGTWLLQYESDIVATPKALLFHLLFFRIITPWLLTHFWCNRCFYILVKIIVTTSHNYWSLNSHLTTCPVTVLKYLAQWSISIPPRNIRKPLVFWHFQGVYKWSTGLKWVHGDCSYWPLLKTYILFKFFQMRVKKNWNICLRRQDYSQVRSKLAWVLF